MKIAFFMQDNAPIHTARNVKNFLQERNIPCLDQPPQSPDLNPIENLDELWAKIKEKWDRLDNEYCRRFIEGIPKRFLAVKAQKGYTTKY